MLRLWNTASRSLEAFQPILEGRIGLYTCGPTVYNPMTLGNWRAFLFDDLLARTLRSFGYAVTHVMNITDVGHLVGDGDEGEDKVEREAATRSISALELARSLEDIFLREMETLHIVRPTVLPRATEHIQEQIVLVKTLEEKGFVYRTSDGIYFDTAKFPHYGALSGQKLDQKEAGARVAVHPEKRHPSDFALWKFSPETTKRQMEWESPWGVGFPGWHLECSAMAATYLGQPFDIHVGGVDHIAVHHENEIAQSEAAHGVRLANYWLHNEFLLIDGGRMGKSLGNAYTLQDIEAKQIDLLAYRYFTLGAHYRSKLNFTWEALLQAEQSLERLRAIVRGLDHGEMCEPDHSAITLFREALEDDINAPKALAVLWEVARSDLPSNVKRATLLKMDDVLGLGLGAVREEIVIVPEGIRALADERSVAKEKKDWVLADAKRAEIAAAGWDVQDTKEGFVLKPIKNHQR